MKKLLFPLLLMALFLSACGAAQNTTDNAGSPPAGTLPPLSTVAVGLLRLEGTDQAVTAEQAAQLLPLWEVYNTLSQSDTAAPAEVEALAQQMQDGMTDGQMEAIQALNLTQQDVFALMESMGLTVGPQAGGAQTSNGDRPQFSGGMPEGGPPVEGGGPGFAAGGAGGGDPMAGGGIPGGANASGTRTPGDQAAGGRGMGARLPSVLIQAVIDLLKERAAAQ